MTFKLSFAQERLFFLDQLEPGSGAYNLVAQFDVHGSISGPSLEQALRYLVERHESLRTRFVLHHGVPEQQIEPTPSTILAVSNAEAWETSRLETELEREANMGFRLDVAPLFRARLFVLGADRAVLSFCLHHLISDGLSTAIILRELSVAYDAYRAGTGPQLPPLSIQYVDYAAWQRKRMDGTRLERELDFWKRSLQGAPLSLDLPADRPRPPQQSSKGSTLEIPFSGDVLPALQHQAESQGVTTFMLLLAAYAFLISEQVGRRDLIIGVPVVGRNHRQAEGLIGFFANSLPLRLTWGPKASFREIVSSTKVALLGALEHQDVPLAKLVEAINPPRDLSRSPLFQLMFTVQEDLPAAIPFGGIELRPRARGREGSQFDLTLTCRLRGKSILASFEYSSDLFDLESIRTLGARFVHLVDEIAKGEAPRYLSGADLVDLAQWEKGPEFAPPSANVNELIRRACERNPEQDAIVDETGAWTFRRLDMFADRVARGLIERGVTLGDRVALEGKVTPTLIAGLIGILRAGATYVPLALGESVERAAQICEDALAVLVVTTSDFTPKSPVPRFDLDKVGEPTRAVPREISPLLPAYVLFTSGTTGRPKGVIVPHSALVSYVTGFAKRLDLGPQDRLLQFASLSFDVSAEEIFGSLGSGATLVLRPTIDRISTFLEWASAQRISVLDVPTAFWHEIVDVAVPRGKLWPELREVIIGTEPVDRSRVTAWRGVFPGRPSLRDMYGPTETTIASSGAHLSNAKPDSGVGRPTNNTYIRLLRHGERVVPGADGEVCIGGAGVAHGYVGDPRQTAARFVPDPFSTVPGARLYRTGDIGRWNRDGCILLQGRADDQIKLRGFRIELGEVEARLRQLPGIAASVAVLREDRVGEKYLAAYVVPQETKTGSVNVESIREQLATLLPSYMIPSTFSVLDALPLGASGKVDRKQLPAPVLGDKAAEFIEPSTPHEVAIAKVFSELLSVDNVGRNSNFFELGGHSLLAIRFVTRLAEEFQIEISVSSLFAHPTVAALAQQPEVANVGTITAIKQADRSLPLPLSYAQERIFFLEQLEDAGGAYHLTTAYRIQGSLRAEFLAQAFVVLCERHEALRTRFELRDGAPVQLIEAPPRAVLLQKDASGWNEVRLQLELTDHINAALPLSESPLLRATLLRKDEACHFLLVKVHHIVADGWSVGIMMRELSSIYDDLVLGEAPSLPSLPIQYADYAAWQRDSTRESRIESELEFWEHELSEASLIVEFPTDLPRPRNQTFRGATVSTTVPAPINEALARVGKAEGATLFMVLLSAYYAWISNYSGKRDVVVGVPTAGRTLVHTEDLVGMFVETLPLRATWSRGTAFTKLLHEVKHRTTRALEHQTVPLAKLIERLNPERDMSRSPIFQVVFSMQNTPDAALELHGAQVEELTGNRRFAQFDITVSCSEAPDGTLDILLEYNTALFERGTAERMIARYVDLLVDVSRDPNGLVGRLGLPDAAEQRRLVREWNPTARNLETEISLFALFAKQAKRFGERPAIVCGQNGWTYRQLLARAEEYGALYALMPPGPVAVQMARSFELVSALLGASAARRAYVPIDPTLPATRREYILHKSGAGVLVLDNGADVGAWGGASLRPSEVKGSRELRTGAAHPDDLAYILFTSGSTGEPKGVAVTNAGLVNHLLSMAEILALDEACRWLAITTISFDISELEIFSPLIVGGVTVVATDEEVKDPSELVRHLSAGEISIFQATPAMYSTLFEFGWTGSKNVQLLCGGEAIPESLGERLTTFSGRAWNVYGPTETTIWSAATRLTGDRIRVGGPIWNTSLYVLSENWEEAGDGFVGELFIGGLGLARGYVGRSDLTAERFVPDPHALGPGARMYRTGDRVRRHLGGDLEFLGRVDNQVKLRGFRIELGEIEAAIQEQPGVENAAVILREDTPGEKYLAAYVVTKQADLARSEALLSALAKRLPTYMVPKTMTLLERLPLSPSGKIDRKALPAPHVARSAQRYREPRTWAEQKLAEIWCLALGRRGIGAGDNFFELGGDSIVSMRVVSFARAGGLALTTRDVFEHPVLSDLARIAKPVSESETSQGPVWGPVPLTPIQRRFFRIRRGHPAHHNQAVLLSVVQMDAQRVESAFRALAHHHDMLRTRYRLDGDAWTQTIQKEIEAFSVEAVDLSSERNETLASAVERVAQEAQQGLDLAGRLIRLVLLDLGARGQRLLLVVHHLLIDGVSWRILLEDLGSLLESDGRTPLPKRSGSFLQWAKLIASSFERFLGELPYWRGLSTAEVGHLPLLRPESGTFGDVGIVRSELSESETREVLHCKLDAYRLRIEELFVIAVALTLRDVTNSRKVYFELEGHGRESELLGAQLDTSRTVGWFTTLYPVVLDLAHGDLPVIIKSLKEQLRAIPSHGLGYGILRELGRPEVQAELSQLPSGNFVFNYLGQFVDRLPGGLARAPEIVAGLDHPDDPVDFAVSVDVATIGDRLTMQWSYDSTRVRQQDVERWALIFRAHVQHLCAHLGTAVEPVVTPADFPLVHLSQVNLDSLVTRIPGQAKAVSEVYSLSPLQSGLLFESMVASVVGAYHVQLGADIAGIGNVSALVEAWRLVVERHDVLRASFHWEALPHPVQVIHRSVDPPIERGTWLNESQARQDELRRAYFERDRQNDFDLTLAPLFRVGIFEIATGEVWMAFSHHHLLLDGWSIPNLFRDVLALYHRINSGESPRAEPDRAYRSFLFWLAQRNFAASEAFWTRRMRGLTEPTPLPSYVQSSPERLRAEAFQEVSLVLEEDETAVLTSFVQRNGFTTSAITQAAWALILSMSSRTPDVTFGVTVSGRSAPVFEIDTAVGLFVNTLPFRTTIDPNQTLVAWIGGIVRQNAEMQEHEHSSLTEIQTWSSIPRGRPLFESLLLFENVPATLEQEIGGDGIRIGNVEGAEQTHYPLTITAKPGLRFSLGISFDTGRFKKEAIAKILRRMKGLLSAIPRTESVGELALFDELVARDQERISWLARVEGPVDRAHLQRAIEAVGVSSIGDRGDDDAVSRFEEVETMASSDEALLEEIDAVRSKWEASESAGVRAALFRQGADRGVVLVSLPRASLGTLSMGALLEQMALNYASLEQGGGPVTPAADPRPFSLFERAEEAETFWREQLRGVHGPLSLGILSQAVQARPRFETESRSMDPFLAKELLRALARETWSGESVVHAAWALVLSRYSGQARVVYGAEPTIWQRATEYLPHACLVDERSTWKAFIGHVATSLATTRSYQRIALDDLRRLSGAAERDELVSSTLLFESVPFENRTIAFGTNIRATVCSAEHSEVPIQLVVTSELHLAVRYDAQRVERAFAADLLAGLAEAVSAALLAPDTTLLSCKLDTKEQTVFMEQWNATGLRVPRERTVDQLVYDIAAEDPSRVALWHNDRSVTYRELVARVEELATRLRAAGASSEVVVGVHLPRSIDMVVALIAILRAGAAYVPLDPRYPADRTELVLRDSGISILCSYPEDARSFDVKCVDPRASSTSTPASMPGFARSVDSLCYRIYTSGSSGRPKGVDLTHANLINFFLGMDAKIGPERGTWLAVTSISFDIAGLELLWTLSRGFTVVIQDRDDLVSAGVRSGQLAKVDFSLFFFGNYAREGSQYEFILEAAKFADQHDFLAVYTPERHFAEFGGYFPNPSILAAVIASHTSRISVRAGSVVLPLHSPVRVAEEWAVVDQISKGRVAISIASGWHAGDFVLAPANYQDRWRIMREGIELLRKLWRGETVKLVDGTGKLTDVRTFPRPVQGEVPIFVTAAGNAETFRLAGELGGNLLTHILGQTWEELETKIAVYRSARAAAGHEGPGRVVLMLHTFVGEDLEQVRRTVREPFREYLRTSLGLVHALAKVLNYDIGQRAMAPEDVDAVLDIGFERYFGSHALMGTVESCIKTIDQARSMGVDEIGCLVDFGVPNDLVLESLERLNALREKVQGETLRYSVADNVALRGVSHLQCTPSFARVLAEHVPEALAPLRALLVGGEALSGPLARSLHQKVKGAVMNMYGPTETTIWSSTATVNEALAAMDVVSLGDPIANTSMWILDGYVRPVPRGVIGELYIGGLGVARGYHGRPDLTAERFLPDPFSAALGARLYRTGDLVRMTSEGILVYLGRADFQVKIRGHRIELGEIEARILSHPEVRECVVTAQGTEGDRVLVAYWVPRRTESVKVDDVREHIARDLPEFMHPSTWVQLSALPLTPNGKIDRKALPKPEQVVEQSVPGGRAPAGPVELELARMWSDILGVRDVSTATEFFSNGGHSLSAMQLVVRVRSSFNVDIPVKVIFEKSSFLEFSNEVSARMAGPRDLRLPPSLTSAPLDVSVLSYGEERLWFLQSFAPASAAYNEVALVRLLGNVDARHFADAVRVATQRHDALRTSYDDVEGSPKRVVHSALDPSFHYVDLSSESDSSEACSAAVSKVISEPFDLARPPLFRFVLYALGADQYVFLICAHHIVTDGWSMNALMDELTTIFDSLRAGNVPHLPDKGFEYRDYAAWQRSWLRGEALDTRVAYWAERLKGVPRLFSSRQSTNAKREPGHVQTFEVSPELGRQLKAFVAAENLTLFNLLMGTYKIILARAFGARDFAVGTPVANRPLKELEGLVGFFLNTVPLRTRFEAREPVRSLLRRVKEETLAAYGWMDAPFEQVLASLAVERDLDSTPVFQALFVLQNLPGGKSTPGGVTVLPMTYERQAVKFPMALTAFDAPDGGVSFAVEFRTDMFEPWFVEALFNSYVHLLHQISLDANASWDQLPLLPTAVSSRRDDVVPVNLLPAPRGYLAEQFVACAKRSPDARALVFEGSEISYDTLEHVTGVLASRLVARGVGPDVLVPIHMQRSPEFIAAVLAVIRAGGAYVPLDPELEERSQQVIADTCAEVVLVGPGSSADFGSRGLLVDLGELKKAPTKPFKDPPVHGSQLAYVIYTSGTTGKAKGTLNTHDGLRNQLACLEAEFGVVPTDILIQKTQATFDASVWEILLPFFVGATLVVGGSDAHRDPAGLVALVAERGVSIIQLVPTLLRAMLEEPGVSNLASLRSIMCGGEALGRELVARAQELLPHVKVHNLYGPAEAAIQVTYWTCATPVEPFIPIGRAVPGVSLHVLDENLLALPQGAKGELCIAGVQVGRGYFLAPDLSADRFRPDPFGTGGRLYKTGDLVREHPGGIFEYFGREDQQVKIRGVRLELGEVEVSIQRTLNCSQVAAVVTPGDAPELVAFLGGATFDKAWAQSQLRALPRYLRPSRLVFLPALPLNPNGKVDRRQLRVPDDVEQAQEAPSLPLTALERLITKICAGVLEVAEFGPEQDLFERGAHSLHAMKIIARIRSDLGVELAVRQFFEAPTVRALAVLARAHAENPEELEIIADTILAVEAMSDEEVELQAKV